MSGGFFLTEKSRGGQVAVVGWAAQPKIRFGAAKALSEEMMKNYNAARLVWGVAYLLGVITLVLGFLVTGLAVFIIFGGNEKERSQAIIVAPCAAGASVVGLLMMALSDLVEAVVDIARNTQAMLEHIRNHSARK